MGKPPGRARVFQQGVIGNYVGEGAEKEGRRGSQRKKKARACREKVTERN